MQHMFLKPLGGYFHVYSSFTKISLLLFVRSAKGQENGPPQRQRAGKVSSAAPKGGKSVFPQRQMVGNQCFLSATGRETCTPQRQRAENQCFPNTKGGNLSSTAPYIKVLLTGIRVPATEWNTHSMESRLDLHSTEQVIYVSSIIHGTTLDMQTCWGWTITISWLTF